MIPAMAFRYINPCGVKDCAFVCVSLAFFSISQMEVSSVVSHAEVEMVVEDKADVENVETGSSVETKSIESVPAAAPAIVGADSADKPRKPRFNFVAKPFSTLFHRDAEEVVVKERVEVAKVTSSSESVVRESGVEKEAVEVAKVTSSSESGVGESGKAEIKTGIALVDPPKPRRVQFAVKSFSSLFGVKEGEVKAVPVALEDTSMTIGTAKASPVVSDLSDKEGGSMTSIEGDVTEGSLCDTGSDLKLHVLARVLEKCIGMNKILVKDDRSPDIGHEEVSLEEYIRRFGATLTRFTKWSEEMDEKTSREAEFREKIDRKIEKLKRENRDLRLLCAQQEAKYESLNDSVDELFSHKRVLDNKIAVLQQEMDQMKSAASSGEAADAPEASGSSTEGSSLSEHGTTELSIPEPPVSAVLPSSILDGGSETPVSTSSDVSAASVVEETSDSPGSEGTGSGLKKVSGQAKVAETLGQGSNPWLDILGQLSRDYEALFGEGHNLTVDDQRIIAEDMRFGPIKFNASHLVAFRSAVKCANLKHGCLQPGSTFAEHFDVMKGAGLESQSPDQVKALKQKFWKVYTRQFLYCNYQVCKDIMAGFEVE